ncbi:MAG TPA: hypothetical protein VGP72_29300 [Planctomycetota bacterium]|jgi:hypothetical protein
MKLFKHLLLASVIAAAVCAADGPPTPLPTVPQKAPFYLIVDYLPAAIYDSDALVASLRIENTTGKEAKLDGVCSALDAKGAAKEERKNALTVAASGFTHWPINIPIDGCTQLHFNLKQGEQSVASVKVRLLQEEAPWPATRITGGHLQVADTGEILLPVTSKVKAADEDRAFAPIKSILHKVATSSAAAGLVFVPARWRLNAAETGLQLNTLGPILPNGVPPVLCAADQVLTRAAAVIAANAKAGQAGVAVQYIVLCLPPEDFDVATDPRVYRTVLDALLARLNLLPLGKVVVVPPIQYGVREKYRQTIWREVRESTAGHRIRMGDGSELLEERLWRVDMSSSGAYGQAPNAGGLKKTEQWLLNLIP